MSEASSEKHGGFQSLSEQFFQIITVYQRENIIDTKLMGQIKDNSIIITVYLQRVTMFILPGLRKGFTVGKVQFPAPDCVEDNLMTVSSI